MSTPDRAALQRLIEQAREATGVLRDYAREHGMNFRQRDPLVIAIHRALDAVEESVLSAAPGEQTTQKLEPRLEHLRVVVAARRDQLAELTKRYPVEVELNSVDGYARKVFDSAAEIDAFIAAHAPLPSVSDAQDGTT